MLRILFYIVTCVILAHLDNLNYLITSHWGLGDLSFHFNPVIIESTILALVILTVHRTFLIIKKVIPSEFASLVQVEFAIITLKYLSLKLGYMKTLFYDSQALAGVFTSQSLWIGYLLFLTVISIMCFRIFIRKSI